MVAPLPRQMHVFVRDWLSSNNILLKSPDGHVLIDTGYVRHAPLTLALLRSQRGLGNAPLTKIVNTHCHSDHIGGNATIQRAYNCGIALPEGEAPLIARWDTKALWLDYADQRTDRFAADEILCAGSTYIWGNLEWRAIMAPGHDMGALVFYNPEYRILISGDALWENGFGLVMPRAVEPDALPATRATLDTIAALDVRVVIPGHGQAFTDAAAALTRAYARVAAFEADDARVARHALKVLLTFQLLDRQRMPVADLPAYVEHVGMFRDINAACLRLPPDALAELLVRELVRAGAVSVQDEFLVPN